MSAYEIYSKRRKRRARSGESDVFQYEDIPHSLRVQIVHIWNDAIGEENSKAWTFIHDTLAREKGVFYLGKEHAHNNERCVFHLLNAESVDDVLDIVELSFQGIERVMAKFNSYRREQCGITQGAEDAIAELNHRFLEHSVGYRFESGEILRVDSLFVHAEVVKPALTLLNVSGFEKAQEEFLLAHKHYRGRKYKDCITAANRSFESALKAVCASKGWTYATGARATDLIKVLNRNHLFPDWLDEGLSAYVAMLKTGLPSVRNNVGGHGAAPDATKVPAYFASYALHMTAANILLICEAAAIKA